MRVAIDACSLINLHNGDCLRRLISLTNWDLMVGPTVLEECGPPTGDVVGDLLSSGSFKSLDANSVNADRFLQIAVERKIGMGESECIAFAEQHNLNFCTDDGRARRVASTLLGSQRVMGSARILKAMVETQNLHCSEAAVAFEAMKDAGGFLPNLDIDFFCPEV
ncbi:MAG: hypothetical protein AAFV51_12815 [Pseudomonadota bacterium]